MAAAPTLTSTPKTIDFHKLLTSDPILNQSLETNRAQLSGYQGQLNEGVNRALAQYGDVPANLPDWLKVDPTTTGLAQQATQGGASTLAQLQHSYELANRSSINSLGARGIVRSGGVGTHLNENLRNFNLQNYQALQGLMDTINNSRSNYLTQQQTLNQSDIGATQDALNRIISQISTGVLANPNTTVQAAGLAPQPYPQHAVFGGGTNPFYVTPNRGRALL